MQFVLVHSVRKMARGERVIVLLRFVRQHLFQTRKQLLCFGKTIWPCFKGLQCVSPYMGPHENMSKVGKSFKNLSGSFCDWIICCTDQICLTAQYDAGAASSAAVRIPQTPLMPSEWFCQREQGRWAGWVSY